VHVAVCVLQRVEVHVAMCVAVCIAMCFAVCVAVCVAGKAALRERATSSVVF